MRTILMQFISGAACLCLSCTAMAQVVVNGGNVSVNTAEGSTVKVDGGKVAVKTPPGGKAAVAVGSGRTAVNVGSGNEVSNTAGTIESGAVERPANSSNPANPSKRSGKGGVKDGDDFWGEKGFWGDEGEPGERKPRKKSK